MQFRPVVAEVLVIVDIWRTRLILEEQALSQLLFPRNFCRWLILRIAKLLSEAALELWAIFKCL
jgi:hypothetical protein